MKRQPKTGNDWNGGDVVQWLEQHDISLWAGRVKVPDARMMCSRDIGQKVGQKRFSAVRRLVCNFWKVEPPVRLTEADSLTGLEWEALNAFVRSWKDSLMSVSVHEAAHLAVMCGVRCNAELLAECLAWKRLQFERMVLSKNKEVFGGEFAKQSE